MKLQAKNLEDLGVLNGPDLGLVNETLGSISPTSLAVLGPKAAADRVKKQSRHPRMFSIMLPVQETMYQRDHNLHKEDQLIRFKLDRK
jgi:hypothetical protein